MQRWIQRWIQHWTQRWIQRWLKGPRECGQEGQENPLYWLKVLEIVANKGQAVHVAHLKELFEDEEREQEQGVTV